MAWQLVHENERLRDEVAVLREAIRRLAEQDATLSVQNGNVTVTMDATLTDAEREAVGRAAARAAESFADIDAAALRGLLERHCPTPESSKKQDTTPQTHSNQSEGSVPPEWMMRPFYVDPPAGHRYGFPKLYDPAADGDMTAWLIASGYPEKLARKNLPCTFTAATDAQ